MRFGEATDMLEQGKKVQRAGWNGKGMFIYLVKGKTVRAKDWTGPVECIQKMNINGVEERGVVLNDHIDMKCADGTICVGWLASQTDMLADDWCVIE